MNKTTLIKCVATQTGFTIKETSSVIDSFLIELSNSLQNENVSIKDFGTFRREIKKERTMRNPQTGEPLLVPEKEVVKFKASKNVLKLKWL